MTVDEERTNPTVQCDGDPGCEAEVRVLFLGTGERMCPHCAVDALHVMVAEPALPDTDKPEAGASGP